MTSPAGITVCVAIGLMLVGVIVRVTGRFWA